MNSTKLKKELRQAFPSLKKPWFGNDPITLRDTDYPTIAKEIYFEIDAMVWEYIEEKGIQYKEGFPDCDDFADIKLGKFKEIWDGFIKRGRIPEGTPPSYAVSDGINPHHEIHDFNIFYSDKIYISDYGSIVDPIGYEPILLRF